ncbi:hypothetical protein [Nitrososphaera sp. AFS]|uniref:hypothetical protein n=1 Tax=Nitrososphaera sp. AFS TaxID=2301191 RepID=UPI0019173CCF|nr:hypothetical protein [Nitrososphaera sp. AFS]NAL78412.1 hypothetical protein [Nitrososphaera sp. AFS]
MVEEFALADGLKSTKNLITIASGDIWNRYITSTEAETIGKSTCESAEFGKRSEQILIKMVKDNFKAQPPKHTGTRRELEFSRRIMKRLARKYKLEDVQIKEITREEKQRLRHEWQQANRVFRDEIEGGGEDDDETETDET